MAQLSNKQLAERILELVGGKENVMGVTHCITRLRIVVKDLAAVKDAEIKKLGVVGTNTVGNQFQVIIGPKVADVFKEFEPLVGKPGNSSEGTEKKPVLSRVIDTFTGIFVPILPAIIGAGLLKGILLFCMFFGLVSTDSDMYKLLSIFNDAAFYFLPMLLAVSTATHFKCNKFIAMCVAGILLHPDLVTMMGGENVIHFFGVPVMKASYGSSVLPIILSVFIMSYVERFFAKVVPSILRTLFVPLFTVFVTGFIALTVVGPAGNVISSLLASNFLNFYQHYGWIAGALFSGFLPLMVMLGIHNGFSPIQIQSISTTGFDYLMGLNVASNAAQAGATLAVATMTKNKDFRTISSTAAVNAMIGITEPALYGVTSKLKKPLIVVMIAGAIGGGIAGFFHVTATGVGTGPLAGMPLFFTDTFLYYVISCLVSFVLAFIGVRLVGFEDIPEEESAGSNEETAVPEDGSRVVPEEIYAPITGRVIPLENVEDTVFSSKMMGDGVAIEPEEGRVYAPFDGEVSATVDSRHAIGMTGKSGCEILIHVGLNTVELNGEGFQYHVAMGDSVKKGDLLLEFDINGLREKGYSFITPVIVANSGSYSSLRAETNGRVKSGDALIYVEK